MSTQPDQRNPEQKPDTDQLDMIGFDDDVADLLRHLDDDLLNDKRRWPGDLIELFDLANAEIIRHGYAKEDAEKIAACVMVALSFQCGGRGFYLPKGETLKQAIRDKQLYADFKGDNISELVSQYGLSQPQVYQIIKQQRLQHRRKYQTELFSHDAQ